MANIEIEVEKIRQAIYGEEVRGSICDALLAMNSESSNAMSYAQTAQDSAAAKAREASASAATAQTAAEDAASSVESQLSGYVLQASNFAQLAQSAAETAAEDAVTDAETQLNGYVQRASNSAGLAARHSEEANESANGARSSLIIAQGAEARAIQASSLSRQWAEGPNGDPDRQPSATNNAMYWASEAARIAQSITAGITPMGSVTFDNLPQEPEVGWMYKIIDAFTTDSRFDDGPGVSYSAGTSVYYTAQNKWTVAFSSANIGTISIAYIDSLFN